MVTMAEFLASLIGLTAAEDIVLRVIISLIILVLGHLFIKLLMLGARNTWINGKDITKKEIKERNETLQYLQYILDAGVIVAALLYLNSGVTSEITAEFVNFLPNLLTVILIGILGFIAINLFTRVGTEFLKALGVKEYFREVGLSGGTIEYITGFVRAFLYLLLLQIALEQIGIGDTFINELVMASSWAFAFMAAGLLFWGFKDLFRDLAAGFYLKNSRMVRPGEEIRIGDETGEIQSVSLFSTTVSTDKGYTLLKPNTSIVDADLRFKRTKNDIETLEDIKNFFVPEEKTGSGPACVEMALDIFGYRAGQGEINEKLEEETVEELMKAVGDLTQEEVRTGFVEKERINSFSDELKAWFNDGSLAIITFDKEKIFSGSTGKHALAVGVEGNEILLVDPNTRSGGVYFVDGKKVRKSMGDDDGYIVLAPKGTTSHWRLKNSLLYSNKNYYEELSKTLEARLTKIMRQGRIMRDVMPNSVREYVEDWRTDRYASRLWKPMQDNEEDEVENETSKDNEQ